MKLKIHEAKVEVHPENDVALITGDGRTFPEDMKTFLDWKVPHDVMAIGRSINLYPGRVMHWANVDGSESIWWAEHLPIKNDGKMPIRHTLGECRGYDIDWDVIDEPLWEKDANVMWHGSTALFATLTCITLGYKKIILAGCPLDSKGHWYFDNLPNNTGPRWLPETYQVWFEFAKNSGSEKVKSLSGYTSQIVGMATKEWLDA